MEQQPQINIQDLLLLKSQIEQDAMRRNTGIEPLIPQYDVPREVPSMRSSNTQLGDLAGRLLGPLVGELVSEGERGVKSVPDLAYALSGLELAADGGKNISEGMNDGSPLRVAGGAAEVGLAALPFSGKALQAAYKSVPRAMGTGAAYGASPLVAAGVLSPEDAQAAEEGSIFDLPDENTLSNLTPVAVAALTAGLAKRYGMNKLTNQKQEASDLDRILANRERAQIAKDDFPIPNFRTKIDHELREREPIKYHDKDNDYLLREKVALDEAGDQNIKDLWKVGAFLGGLSSSGADIAMNGDFDLERTGLAAIQGITAGAVLPAFTSKRYDKKPNTTIDRYDPNPDKKPFIPNGPSDQLRLGRSPIAEAHPIETRAAIERRLKKGEAVKGLAEEYGIHQSNLYRWKKKLNKRVKKSDKTPDRTE